MRVRFIQWEVIKIHGFKSNISANGLRPDWFSCQKYLALVNLKLRANSLAELFARQSKSSLMLIRSLLQQNVKEKTDEAVELCNILIPSESPSSRTELLELNAA